VTAFVPGPQAAHYQFTSSLPVRVLGLVLPALEPLLQHADDDAGADTDRLVANR
jgi:hypothetical protein